MSYFPEPGDKTFYEWSAFDSLTNSDEADGFARTFDEAKQAVDEALAAMVGRPHGSIDECHAEGGHWTIARSWEKEGTEWQVEGTAKAALADIIEAA